MPDAANGVIHAYPSKAFFIDMLTRDIGLSDCILDLVDNAVSSLVVRDNLDIMQSLLNGTNGDHSKGRIDISFSESKFVIEDNCGGISIDDARDQVFLFGNPNRSRKHTGLGVYGIGMKRAFFKIGRKISVVSHTTEEEFRVDIDVDAWEQDDKNWDFHFTYARPKKSSSGGTKVTITELMPVPASQFVATSFLHVLQARVSRSYALFLREGLEIRVKTEAVQPDLPQLAESKNLRAVKHSFKQEGVDVLIIAGLSPKEDRKPRGWYVFCNGRLVLEADKTERTGWGINQVPAFHSKFNHFLGYVYFKSKDVRKLPWTTTKEDIDRESPLFQAALVEMRLLARPIIDFLNTLYGEVSEQSEPERNLFDEAKPVPVDRMAGRPNTTFKATVDKPKDEELVSIQYKRTRKKLDQVRRAIGKPRLSAGGIGEYTFDWYFKRNCDNGSAE